jgi:hypothetical protein
MAILERVSDEHGSVVLGWAHAGVFYARFEGSVSVAIAQRFARRFAALIGDTIRVRYFGDSSAVTSYDPEAMAPIASAMMSKRHRFVSIIVRPWNGVLGAPARAFADAFGCLEYVTSAIEFERRFRAVVPNGDIGQFSIQRGEAPPDGEAGTEDAEAAAAPVAKQGDESVTYSYVFDLSDFEAGRFTATRSEQLGERPGRAWVCVARDDQQALELARQAALLEWAKPSSRRPEDFSVQFHPGEVTKDRPVDWGQ